MEFLKTLLAVSILGILGAPVSFILPVKAAAGVNILSHTGYLDSSGYYHVVGEVQNVGDTAVDFVKIEATFYDSSNAEIAGRFDLTMLNVLLTGRKSPFNIALLDTTQSAEVDHYDLSITFLATAPTPMALDILSHTTYTYVDELVIVGEIMNIGTEKATDVRVIATFLNSQGEVIAATYTYLYVPAPEESDIDPDQTVQFTILLSDANIAPNVRAYELTAESFQYACVSEETGELEFLPTDLNNDGTVDILDIAIVAKAFGTKPGDENWDPIADTDRNAEINILDIARVALDFGKTD